MEKSKILVLSKNLEDGRAFIESIFKVNETPIEFKDTVEYKSLSESKEEEESKIVIPKSNIYNLYQ